VWRNVLQSCVSHGWSRMQRLEWRGSNQRHALNDAPADSLLERWPPALVRLPGLGRKAPHTFSGSPALPGNERRDATSEKTAEWRFTVHTCPSVANSRQNSGNSPTLGLSELQFTCSKRSLSGPGAHSAKTGSYKLGTSQLRRYTLPVRNIASSHAETLYAFEPMLGRIR
jgi:hypothetical protein